MDETTSQSSDASLNVDLLNQVDFKSEVGIKLWQGLVLPPREPKSNDKNPNSGSIIDHSDIFPA